MNDLEISQTLANVQQSLAELQDTISRIKQEIDTEPELPKLPELPEPGTIIWVRDYENQLWRPRIFCRMAGPYVVCFMDDKSSGLKLPWNYWMPLKLSMYTDPNIEESK